MIWNPRTGEGPPSLRFVIVMAILIAAFFVVFGPPSGCEGYFAWM